MRRFVKNRGTAVLALCLCVLVLALRILSTQASLPTVAVWLTTTDQSAALTRQPDLAFTANATPPAGSTLITLDDTEHDQSIVGFGAAMTDSSSWLLGHLSPTVYTTTMHLLFDPAQGMGLSFVRVPMGASDYTHDATMYSYDDQPPGRSDPTLHAFTMTRDLTYTIPALRDARVLNPALTFLANPWSAPGWMKANDQLSNLQHSGPLLPANFQAFAQYFVRFLQAYKAQGVPIALVTPENEPGAAGGYPSMDLDPQHEAAYVGQYLGPALAAAHLSTKILAFDEGWSDQGYNSYGVISKYPYIVLSDPAARASLAGVAYHCYDGYPTSMSALHDAYPTMDVYMTECDGHASFWPHAASLIIESTRNWARAVSRWNIALDPSGGPKNPSGCPGCAPLVTVDRASDAVTPSVDLYQIGQASRFILPGSVRIGSNEAGPGGLEDVAFLAPDGSHVLLAYNDAPSAQTMTVQWGGASFTTTLPAGATATFTWTGTAPPLPTATALPTETPQASPTPDPTATSTSTPSATASATATASPTASATATASPTASATVTPSPTASATVTLTR